MNETVVNLAKKVLMKIPLHAVLPLSQFFVGKTCYHSIETWTSPLQILHIVYHTPYKISDKSVSYYYSQNNDWF